LEEDRRRETEDGSSLERESLRLCTHVHGKFDFDFTRVNGNSEVWAGFELECECE